MDSNGTPVQYVQDTIPDTSKTIPDPKDPTKQIQDPNATLPKVDPRQLGSGLCRCGCEGQRRQWSRWQSRRDPDRQGRQTPRQAPGLPAGAQAIPEPFTISYKGGILTDDKGVTTANYHESAKSVVAPHKFNYVFIQACVAILILVGFESVTAMGEEAKNPKKDIPKAVILSLLIQGGFCYLFEYFAANYFAQRLHFRPTPRHLRPRSVT